MWKTSIFSDHSAPTEIRVPTLLLDPASVLLDPTKRGLRNPILRVCKTQLARSMCNNQLHVSSSKLHDQLHIKLHIYQVSKCPIKTSSSCSKPPCHQPIQKSIQVIIKPPNVVPQASKLLQDIHQELGHHSSYPPSIAKILQSINQTRASQSKLQSVARSPSIAKQELGHHDKPPKHHTNKSQTLAHPFSYQPKPSELVAKCTRASEVVHESFANLLDV